MLLRTVLLLGKSNWLSADSSISILDDAVVVCPSKGRRVGVGKPIGAEPTGGWDIGTVPTTVCSYAPCSTAVAFNVANSFDSSSSVAVQHCTRPWWRPLSADEELMSDRGRESVIRLKTETRAPIVMYTVASAVNRDNASVIDTGRGQLDC